MWIKIAKYSMALLLIYEVWYIEKFGPVSGMLQGFAIISCVFAVMHYIGRTVRVKETIPKEMYFWWLLFAVYCAISGVFVAKDVGYMFDQLFTFVSFLLTCIIIVVICHEIKSADWVYFSFVISSILCTISILFQGYTSTNQGSIIITLGPNNNPNTLGINMLIGIFSVIMLFGKYKVKFPWFVLMIGFVYVIILSCSRKSLLCAGALIMGWLIWYFWGYFIHLKSIYKITYFVSFVISSILFIKVAMSFYFQSESFERMQLLMENGFSEGGRDKLFGAAIELFCNNPLFGVGYKQYEVVSGLGTYSHSTYGEALACTGIFGCILWFTPYILLGASYVKTIKRKNVNNNENTYILMFAILMILGLGVIHFYCLPVMIVLSLLLMYKNEKRYSNITM